MSGSLAAPAPGPGLRHRLCALGRMSLYVLVPAAILGAVALLFLFVPVFGSVVATMLAASVIRDATHRSWRAILVPVAAVNLLVLAATSGLLWSHLQAGESLLSRPVIPQMNLCGLVMGTVLSTLLYPVILAVGSAFQHYRGAGVAWTAAVAALLALDVPHAETVAVLLAVLVVAVLPWHAAMTEAWREIVSVSDDRDRRDDQPTARERGGLVALGIVLAILSLPTPDAMRAAGLTVSDIAPVRLLLVMVEGAMLWAAVGLATLSRVVYRRTLRDCSSRG